MPHFNFKGIEPAEQNRLEPGDYIARITSVEDTVSNGGTDGIRVHLRLEREVGGAAVDKPWRDTWWLTPKTAPFVAARIQTITGKAPTGNFDFNTLVGKRAVAVIREKPNQNGEKYPEVIGYNELPAGAQDPLLAAASADPYPAGAPAADDDIPF